MGLLTSLAKCADCVNSKLILLTLVLVQLTVGSEWAQAPSRDIFVYRVENEASESEIESHVKDNGIEPKSVVTVSHADALYKSFKLTVSVNDVAKTLDADFWPEGIMVRRYERNPKNGENH